MAEFYEAVKAFFKEQTRLSVELAELESSKKPLRIIWREGSIRLYADHFDDFVDRLKVAKGVDVTSDTSLPTFRG